MTAEL